MIKIAKAPVIGPGPKARLRMMVKISASTPRTKSKTRRTAKRMVCEGAKFCAARKARGIAMAAAPNVPKKAISAVSPIAQTTSPCRQTELYHTSRTTDCQLGSSG